MNISRLLANIALGAMATVMAAPAIWASPALASPAHARLGNAAERESRPAVVSRFFYGDDGMGGMEIDRQDGRVRIMKSDRADKAEPTPPLPSPAAYSTPGPRPATGPGR